MFSKLSGLMKKRTVKFVSVFVLTGTILTIYGNACSVRRGELTSSSSSENASSTYTNSNNSSAAPVANFKLSNVEYDGCLGTGLDFANLPNCLQAKGLVDSDNKSKLTTAIEQCSTESSNKIFMAICLESKGFVIDHHREFAQSDVDKCRVKLNNDDSKLAFCLGKRGLFPASASQADLNNCISTAGVGPEKLEKCMRKKGFLTAKNNLSQFDVNYCVKIGSPNLSDCLLNSDATPLTTATPPAPAFSAADIDACVSAPGVGTTGLVKCLRNSGKLSKVLMQHHLDRCISLVGTGKLAACLDLNGLLPTKPTGVLSQEEIDSCIANQGEKGLLYCLRFGLGVLNRVVTQADINECTRVGGGTSAIAKCLSINSLLPANVTQAVIDACVTAVQADATGAATIAKCLRKKGYLPKALVQGDVNSCLKLVDQTKLATCLNANVNNNATGVYAPLVQTDIDACIQNVGVGKIALCLKNHSLIPTVLTQEHINACSLFGGLGNIQACLDGSGFSGSVSVPITQVMVDTCVGNVGLPNLRKCLVKNLAISGTISVEDTKACTLFAGATPELLNACYTANGLGPI